MENYRGKEISLRKAIGLQVIKQLTLRKMSQEKAAILAGITDSQMSAVVNGTTNYTIDTLTRVVLAINEDRPSSVITLNSSLICQILCLSASIP